MPAATQFAAYLQSLGLAKGDRVAIMMPNVPQYPVAVAAILRAGYVVVNVNPLYTPRELEHQLKDSGAKAIVVIENFADHVGEAPDRPRPVKHVVLCAMGDQLGLLKGALGQLRGAQRQEDGAGIRVARPQFASTTRLAMGATRHCNKPVNSADDVARLAVHRRYHRRVQGRRAVAPQPGCQRAAVRGLEQPALMRRIPEGVQAASACAPCRFTISSRSPLA